MNNIVDQTTDNTPVDLDAHLTEFEKYAREFLPKVSPNSPLYRAEQHSYDYSSWVPYDKVIATIAPDIEVPAWHDPDTADEFRTNAPCGNGFISSDYHVRVSREVGVKDVEGITFPSVAVRIIQGVNSREPYLEAWMKVAIKEDGAQPAMKWAHGSRMRFTLAEATEFANLLLLLVDVARDPSGQGGAK